MEDEDIKNKKEYELAVLVANEGDLASINTVLKEHNAEMTAEPKAKNLALSYEIKGHKEAVFAYCLFKALPEDAKILERDLVSNQTIIRSMMLASPAPAERPITAMPTRERKPRTMSSSRPSSAPSEMRSAPSTGPISNEALEKKIEEISQ